MLSVKHHESPVSNSSENVKETLPMFE